MGTTTVRSRKQFEKKIAQVPKGAEFFLGANGAAGTWYHDRVIRGAGEILEAAGMKVVDRPRPAGPVPWRTVGAVHNWNEMTMYPKHVLARFAAFVRTRSFGATRFGVATGSGSRKPWRAATFRILAIISSRFGPDADRLNSVLRGKENSGWGYDRIVVALGNLGHRLSDETVGNILRRHEEVIVSAARWSSRRW